MLRIYNTLTREKEPFAPLDPQKVRLYVCGMTVYDYCHLGHARVMINFDMVARYLRYRGYPLTYVRNITDIDDKIIKRAHENEETISQLTERFIQAMHEDERALNVLAPDQEPRATDHIANIIQLIETLLKKEVAYVGENGDVFYQVEKFSSYGALSQQDLTALRVGERVAIDAAKQDPLDFVLWKLAKPGEPFWDSPWGAGRPGWHIECSAMSMHCLGAHFDIHGGGLDLQFPHHENEIAQSEAASSQPFVNTWMHVGFVQINKEKMSKSLNNFFTIREVLKDYSPEVVRYFILASHYRSPLNYSLDNLESAKAALSRFYLSLRGLPLNVIESAVEGDYESRFVEAMDDDFNTPVALSVLFDLVKDLNKTKEHDVVAAASMAILLRRLASVLGLLTQSPEDFLQSDQPIDTQLIEELIAKRRQARADKDYARADAVREQLNALGIVLEDQAGKTLWRKI